MSYLDIMLDAVGTGLYIVSFFPPLRTGLALASFAAVTLFVAAVVDGSTIAAVIQGFFAATFAWLWWRNGGGHGMKKAAKSLGAKSKARVDALVKKIEPSPIPAPGGAR
jgi:hypothetical protein